MSMEFIEKEIKKICNISCNRNVTIHEILNDMEKCNFCDIPYVYLEYEKIEKKIKEAQTEC